MLFSHTGLEVTGHTRPHALLRGADAVLRGIAQVALQANSYAGVVFLLGVAWCSTAMASALLWGVVVSTTVAAWAGVDRGAWCNGLWGFNGGLAALTTLLFAPAIPAVWLVASLAALGTVPVGLLLQRLLAPRGLPALSLPFITMLWCVLGVSTAMGWQAPAAHAAVTLAAPTALTAELAAGAVLNGVAQVFFQSHWGTGALVLAGLLLSAPRACALTLAGTVAGSVVAWALSATPQALGSGLAGFNGALAALALGQVFLPATARNAALAVLAAGATSVVQWGLSAALAGTGLPALTLPFVVVVWVALPAFERP